jgi:hypothetical protein
MVGGSDTINLIFTAEQLQAILAIGTTRDELQAYLLGPAGDTLNLGATSWYATATGFETANIELANLYANTRYGHAVERLLRYQHDVEIGDSIERNCRRR